MKQIDTEINEINTNLTQMNQLVNIKLAKDKRRQWFIDRSIHMYHQFALWKKEICEMKYIKLTQYQHKGL